MGCTQSSTTLDVYEQQLIAYIESFHIPSDYQERILEMYKNIQSACDIEEEKRALEGRLHRAQDLYKWGHISREEYLAESFEIRKDLGQIKAFDPKGNGLDVLAAFLKDLALAWNKSSQEQKNNLANCLFETVWTQDKKVVAVTPRPEFTPFFDLQYDGLSRYMLQMRPRGALGSEVQNAAYLTEVLCPEIADINCSRWRIPPRVWGKLVKERNEKTSLRNIAKEYGASHEAVKRVLRAIDLSNP